MHKLTRGQVAVIITKQKPRKQVDSLETYNEIIDW